MYPRCEPPMVAHGQPFLEAAIAKLDVRRVNEEYMQALHQLHSSGHLDRPLLLHRLLMWRNMCARAHADVTRGLFNQVCKLVGVTVAELTGFEQMLRAEWPEMVGGCAKAGRSAPAPERIQQSQVFKVLDDGVTLLMMAVSCGAGLAVGINNVAARLFGTSEQVHEYLKTHRILPIHAFASMIAPTDRLPFLQLHVAAYSTLQQADGTLVKFCNSSEGIDVYILRLRRIESPEFPDAHLVTVLQMEPAPTSRYLIPRRGHRHLIVQAFRQRAAMEMMGIFSAACEDNTSAAAAPDIAYGPPPSAHGGGDGQLRHMPTAGEQHEPQGSKVTHKSSPCGQESTDDNVQRSTRTRSSGSGIQI